MRLNITDELISQFMSGFTAVLVLIAVGSVLMFLLRGIARRAPFTRLSLVLGLTPLTLINFIGYKESIALLYFSMSAVLLGILIDGINHLISAPRQSRHERAESAAAPAEATQEETTGENSSVFVWEKAE